MAKNCIILCKKTINTLNKAFYVLMLIATLLNFKWITKYSWYETEHKIISNGYSIPIVFIILITRYIYLIFYIKIHFTLAEILTSNSVGTQLLFLGCNQDNNSGSNFITKKKICLVHQKRKLATIEINKFLI